jgi:hypothetical protein
MTTPHRQAALLVAALLVAVPSDAQLRNCPKLASDTSAYKVVLDDFSYASAAAGNDADLAALKNDLQFNFGAQLRTITSAAQKLNRDLAVPLVVVECPGRQPSLDGQEFTPELAETLSDDRVVVEMWGRFDLRSDAGGTTTRRATVGYVIPPVQHYVGSDVAPPIHVVDYPKSGSTVAAAELTNLPEMPAFALVGLGTKAARAKRYDLASWALNRAEGGLLEAQGAAANPDLDALLGYVRREACKVRSDARRDNTYTGPLKLAPDRPCPESR